MPDTAENLPAQFELNDFLCFAIYTAGHAFNRVYTPLLDALGLTYPQYLLLTALWAEDGQTVGSLGEKLFLESNTLTSAHQAAGGDGTCHAQPQSRGRAPGARAAHGRGCGPSRKSVPHPAGGSLGDRPFRSYTAQTQERYRRRQGQPSEGC